MSQACVRVARGATTTLSRVLADVDLDPRLNGWRLNGWRCNGYRPSAEPWRRADPKPFSITWVDPLQNSFEHPQWTITYHHCSSRTTT